MDEDRPERRPEKALLVLLLAIAGGGAVDLVLDAPTDWATPHVLYELFLIAAALATATGLWRRWRRAERDARRLEGLVARQEAERDAWRTSAQTALAGLAAAIDQQLARWRLTPAEREVVLLLLKGRSHKEIAAGSDRSERTVRQHAASAYQKAGVAGRAELAAFFLQDLPLPSPATPAAEPT